MLTIMREQLVEHNYKKWWSYGSLTHCILTINGTVCIDFRWFMMLILCI